MKRRTQSANGNKLELSKWRTEQVNQGHRTYLVFYLNSLKSNLILHDHSLLLLSLQAGVLIRYRTRSSKVANNLYKKISFKTSRLLNQNGNLNQSFHQSLGLVQIAPDLEQFHKVKLALIWREQLTILITKN